MPCSRQTTTTCNVHVTIDTFRRVFVFLVHVQHDVNRPLDLVQNVLNREVIAIQPLRKLQQVIELLPLTFFSLSTTKAEVEYDLSEGPWLFRIRHNAIKWAFVPDDTHVWLYECFEPPKSVILIVYLQRAPQWHFEKPAAARTGQSN